MCTMQAYERVAFPCSHHETHLSEAALCAAAMFWVALADTDAGAAAWVCSAEAASPQAPSSAITLYCGYKKQAGRCTIYGTEWEN